MPEFIFTKEQVEFILNTLLELPAKVSYDALKLIDKVVAEQAKKENETKTS